MTNHLTLFKTIVYQLSKVEAESEPLKIMDFTINPQVLKRKMKREIRVSLGHSSAGCMEIPNYTKL